jgi:two-component system KDP operon response regulator KdpE
MPPAARTLLVVEDELPILRFLRASLEESGYRVLEAHTGRSALELAASKKPDVVLLDLGLPDMEGLEVLKRLRDWSSAPVIILSARGQEPDKIAGLDAGADDYLAKPFGAPELLARVRVALRHAEGAARAEEPVYEHGDLKVDLGARRVWVKKKEIHLSPLQYELLAFLARRAGAVVGQRQLIEKVWAGQEASAESVRLLVHQLRHKIEADPVRPKHLKTEAGVGYRLEASDE